MRITTFVLALGGFLLSPLCARGDTLPVPDVPIAPAMTTLIISEVAWAGSSASDADEWVELANVGEVPVDLVGWSVVGMSGEVPLWLPTLSLDPGKTFVISNYPAGHEKSILLRSPDLVTSVVSLSNSALTLSLLDAAGTIRDTVQGTVAGRTGSVRASMERVFDAIPEWSTSTATHGILATGVDFGSPGLFTTPSRHAQSDEGTPTIPTELNPGFLTVSQPVPEPETLALPELEPTVLDHSVSEYSLSLESLPSSSYVHITPPVDPPGIQFHNIIINEFDPSDEWVEYRNTTSNDYALEGLSLEDAGGRKFPLTGTLTAHSYRVLALSSGTLNNDGDLVRLRTANGTVIDQVGYGKLGSTAAPNKGQTLSRFQVSPNSDGDFAASDTPTPGAANIVEVPSVRDGGDHSNTDADTYSDTRTAQQKGISSSTADSSSGDAKHVTYKLTLAGPTTLYATQSATFRAVVTPIRETWGPVSWYADGERITEGITADGHGLTHHFAEPGIHVLSAVSGSDGGHVQASRTFTVRAAPVPEAPDHLGTGMVTATSTSSASSKTATKPTAAIPAKATLATQQSAKKPAAGSRSGTSVGILPSLSGTVVSGERLMGVRKLLLENGSIVALKAGKLPAIGPGDTVVVRGKYNTAGTTFTAATSNDIRVTGKGATYSVHPLSVEDNREAYLNRVVSVSGVVGHVQGKTFSVQSDEDILVYWKVGASLPAGLVQVGSTVRVTGILTLRNNEWTILPRGAEDVLQLSPAPAPEHITATYRSADIAGAGTTVALGSVAVMLGLLGAYQVQRRLVRKAPLPAFSIDS